MKVFACLNVWGLGVCADGLGGLGFGSCCVEVWVLRACHGVRCRKFVLKGNIIEDFLDPRGLGHSDLGVAALGHRVGLQRRGREITHYRRIPS